MKQEYFEAIFLKEIPNVVSYKSFDGNYLTFDRATTYISYVFELVYPITVKFEYERVSGRVLFYYDDSFTAIAANDKEHAKAIKDDLDLHTNIPSCICFDDETGKYSIEIYGCAYRFIELFNYLKTKMV